MEEALKRLHEAIEYLKSKGQIHKQQDIVAALGMKQVNVSRALSGTPRYFTENFLRRFAEAYKAYIDKDWLLTGAGQMAVPDDQLHPYLEAKAAAGFLGGGSIPEKGDDLRDLNSFFPEYSFLIKVSGESMEPVISDGDVLICEKLTDSLNPPLNRVCVIDTKEDILVKEIAGVEDDCLILHSFNPRVPDHHIEFSAINGVALVVGSMKTF